MPKVTLSTGEARVSTHHTPFDPSNPQASRSTTVALDFEGAELKTAAVCSVKDQFQRSFGRQIAAQRMLFAMRHFEFTKEDRRIVFQAVCPEWRKTE